MNRFLIFILFTSFVVACSTQKEGTRTVDSPQVGYQDIEVIPHIVFRPVRILANNFGLTEPITIYVRATIDTSGYPRDIKIVRSGGTILDSLASLLAQGYRFSSGIAKGKKVEMRMDWGIKIEPLSRDSIQIK